VPGSCPESRRHRVTRPAFGRTGAGTTRRSVAAPRH
jgi:hypothetical protein